MDCALQALPTYSEELWYSPFCKDNNKINAIFPLYGFHLLTVPIFMLSI